MELLKSRFVVLLAMAAFAAAGCSGDKGDKGDKGDPGTPGTPGAQGPQGPQGPAAPVPVGAGLQVTILGATAPATGPATVTFSMKDAAGTTIDFLAELAGGAFGATRGPRFAIAQAATKGGTYDTALYQSAAAGLPAGAQTRPTSMPASIALSAAAGNYVKNANGTYTFTFPTTAAQGLSGLATGFPLAADAAKQTLVAVQASRVFQGITYPAGASFEFVPDASAATARAVVSDAACNACHKALTAHGTRRTVNLCLTCHTPGWVQNPTANNTANAIDMRVMVHQIHRGQQPTDVQNAAPWVYKWSATGDFSSVAFAPPNTVRNCAFCHQGGAQADNWKTKPSRAACGSCHYAVDFATGVGHAGGIAQANDNGCAGCHPADGSPPAISTVHSHLYDALTNTTFVGADLAVAINSVDVTAATNAKVTFTVTLNGQPVDMKAASANPVSSLRFTVAGPTSDYGAAGGPVNPAGVLQHRTGYVQSANFGGSVAAANALEATGTSGQFRAPLPDLTPAAGQSVGIGVEAYVLETGTCPTAPCAVREWAQRPLPFQAASPSGVVYAKVGGGTAAARRLITDARKCNTCHEDLGFHGGEARKGPDYCAMCHNARNVNDERTSQFEIVTVGGVTQAFVKTPNTVQMSVMIHKIHKGSEMVPSGSLPNPRPVYALGATRDFRAATGRAEGEAPPAAFAGAFVGDLKDCQTCHLAGGYGLPEANVLPTRFVTFTCIEDPAADANAVCGTLSASGGVVAPDTAAGDAFWSKSETSVPAGRAHCGSCHDGVAADAHFAVNTNAGVEACDVCHGDARFMDPIEIHQPRP